MVGESGGDEDGVVGADVEVDGDRGVGGVDGAGGVEEVPPEFVGGGVLVAGELAGEEAVEVPGDDGEGGVEVDVQREA